MNPHFQSNGVSIYHGDVRQVLRELEDESVHCVVTSPPYWGLRDYGTAVWEGGDDGCDHRSPTMREGRNEDRATLAGSAATNQAQLILAAHSACGKCGAVRIDQQIGLEDSPVKYVSVMREVFREVRRVLRSDGTLWLNMGDSYQGGNRGTFGSTRGGESPMQASNLGSDTVAAPNRFPIPGLKPKDLVGVPWMLAFALREDGWYLRQDIIWAKPNPMPESVTDRCTKAHEYIFLLSKSERYFYNADAVKEEAAWERWGDQTVIKEQQGTASWIKPKSIKELREGAAGVAIDGGLPTIEGLGSSPESRTTKQRKPAGWDTGPGAHGSVHRNGRAPVVEYSDLDPRFRNKRSVWSVATEPFPEAHFATFPQELIKPCILAGCPEGGTVLDPFGGSGTTAKVARDLHCKAILVELNADYIQIAKKRLRQEVLEFA